MMGDKKISVIDSHTGGMPTRLLIDGLPPLRGSTMQEKADCFERNHSSIRTGIFREPRGLLRGVGAVLTEPADPRADWGVFFLDSDYPCIPMCGHGLIGVVASLAHQGLISAARGGTSVIIDTPAGLVKAEATISEDQPVSVTFENVPAYWCGSVPVRLPGTDQLRADIAVCGESYGIIQAEALNIPFDRSSVRQLSETAGLIKQQINQTLSAQGCDIPVRHVDAVRFCGPLKDRHIKNMVVFSPGDRGIDRSPCGTGTSAHTALLFFQDQIALREPVIHESIIGSRFTCQALETVEYFGFRAVIPQITGSAFIMHTGTLWLDDRDPHNAGFLLAD